MPTRLERLSWHTNKPEADGDSLQKIQLVVGYYRSTGRGYFTEQGFLRAIEDVAPQVIERLCQDVFPDYETLLKNVETRGAILRFEALQKMKSVHTRGLGGKLNR